MILGYYYWAWNKAIDEKICDEIVNRHKHFEKATTIKESENKGARKNKVTFTNDEELYNLLRPYVNSANEQAGWNFDIEGAEGIQISKYDKDDLYNWHIDGGSDIHHQKNNYVRKLSLVMTLTDRKEYEGGEFEIDLGPHASNRNLVVDELNTKGGLVVMPSFLYHRVKPITKGTRHSLVMWTSGRPFK